MFLAHIHDAADLMVVAAVFSIGIIVGTVMIVRELFQKAKK